MKIVGVHFFCHVAIVVNGWLTTFLFLIELMRKVWQEGLAPINMVLEIEFHQATPDATDGMTL